MRQLVYTMFISNNSASFHLWWKENLIKYQKVSKYYANDCRYNINSFRVGTCALENHSFIHLSCITDATQGGTFKQFFFNLTINFWDKQTICPKLFAKLNVFGTMSQMGMSVLSSKYFEPVLHFPNFALLTQFLKFWKIERKKAHFFRVNNYLEILL